MTTENETKKDVKVKILKYPKDNVYFPETDARIIFTPMVWKPSNSVAELRDQAAALSGKEDFDVEKFKESVSGVLKSLQNTTRFNFSDSLTTCVTKDNTVKIVLPMKPIPINISNTWQDPEVIQFDKNNLGNVFAEQALATVWNKAKGAIKPLEKAEATILASTGTYSIKPTRKAYSGSAPIQLSFEYTFIPQDAAEAKEIKQIIKSFQFLSVSQSGPEAYESSVPLGKNPAIWQISMHKSRPKKEPAGTIEVSSDNTSDTDNEESDIFDRLMIGNIGAFGGNHKNVFPYMVLTSVNVSYAAGTFWHSHRDGFPTEIKLSLNFDEYYQNHSAQVLFGYKSYDEVLA